MKRGTESNVRSPAAEAIEGKAAGAPNMAGLADYVREVMEIASPTADHAELREVIAILETLRDAGIRDLEELKDYIFDYEKANRQNKAMHEKYNRADKVIRNGSVTACPACRARVYRWMNHCGKCGKAISHT